MKLTLDSVFVPIHTTYSIRLPEPPILSEFPPTIGELAEDEEVEMGDFDPYGPHPGQDEMGVRHCFYDFCKQTILHGWHYLADIGKYGF